MEAREALERHSPGVMLYADPAETAETVVVDTEGCWRNGAAARGEAKGVIVPHPAAPAGAPARAAGFLYHGGFSAAA